MWFTSNPGKLASDPIKFSLCVTEFFGTLHFPTTDDATLLRWLAEILELVFFVAYKQAEVLTKWVSRGFWSLTSQSTNLGSLRAIRIATNMRELLSFSFKSAHHLPLSALGYSDSTKLLGFLLSEFLVIV